MKKSALILLLALSPFLIILAGPANAAILWDDQEHIITASSHYWDGSCDPDGGSATPECTDRRYHGDTAGMLPVGASFSASSNMSNSTPTMSTDTHVQVTGADDGYIVNAHALAHNDLSYGTITNSRVWSMASARFIGDFSTDDTTLIIDLALDYHLAAQGLDAGLNPYASSGNHYYEILVSVYQGADTLVDERLYDDVEISGILMDSASGTLNETYSLGVTPGLDYRITIDLNELASIRNQGEAGHLSSELDVDITTSSVPIPGAFWLLGSAVIGLAGLRRRARG